MSDQSKLGIGQIISTPQENRKINGFPGYEVDVHGTVWTRWAHTVGRQRTAFIREKRKPLRVLINWQGKMRVCLYRNGKPHFRSIHRLVLESFIGPCPTGMEACHNNGNGQDNRLSNLRWDTKQSNEQDKTNHGTRAIGERSGVSKLKDAQVLDIRRLHSAGGSLSDLAKGFSVSPSTIWFIIHRQTWKHL